MKLQVKFPVSLDIDGNPKAFMPGETLESTKFDAKLIEGLKAKGFFVPVSEKVVPQSKEIPVGAAEVKIENPKDVIVAQPTEAEKKVESTPIVEQPARKGKANRN